MLIDLNLSSYDNKLYHINFIVDLIETHLLLGALKLNVLISRWIVYGCCLEVIINYYFFFWGCLWIIPFQRRFFLGYNHGFFVPLLKFMVHGPALKVLHRVNLEFERWGPPMWSQWFELKTCHTICTLNGTKDQIMI